METITNTKNWAIGNFISVLDDIHESHVNIAIYNREITLLTTEANSLLEKDIKLRLSGNIDAIINEVHQTVSPIDFPAITNDIKSLLHLFKKVSKAKSFRLFLATIDNTMCGKFHTDINDIRLLCTYRGSGTLWLKEENVNREALSSFGNNGSIAIDKNDIQQAPTGSVVLLKGAIYPKEETKAIVHRSPTIKENSNKRLLLRIDTNEFLNF